MLSPKVVLFLQELLESHLSPDTPPPSPHLPSFPFLANALSVYVRMCMHKRAESGDQEEFGQRVQEVLTWAERVLIPALSATSRWVVRIGYHQHSEIHWNILVTNSE